MQLASITSQGSRCACAHSCTEPGRWGSLDCGVANARWQNCNCLSIPRSSSTAWRQLEQTWLTSLAKALQ